MEFEKPGPEHARLKTLSGAWSATVKQYLEPGAPPQESSGEFLARMDLGGYFLRREMNFGMVGFQGAGLTGWDPFKRSYVGTWVDSSSPLIARTEAYFDDLGRFCETSEGVDPTGAVVRLRLATEMVDPTQMRFRIYRVDDRDNETMIVAIDHTRRRFF